jgi:hypothetical protein
MLRHGACLDRVEDSLLKLPEWTGHPVRPGGQVSLPQHVAQERPQRIPIDAASGVAQELIEVGAPLGVVPRGRTARPQTLSTQFEVVAAQ